MVTCYATSTNSNILKLNSEPLTEIILSTHSTNKHTLTHNQIIMSSGNKHPNGDKMKLAPVRPLNDFLLDSKKYLAPPFNDLKRFNNRVTSNLLYYQTNYFALSTAVFLIFALFRFNRILAGVFGIATTVATALFGLDKIPQASELRRKYPFAVYVAGAVDLMILYSSIRPIMFLLLVVLVPFLGWIAHASMRSRSIKNKVSNKVEQMTNGQVYSNTPMGFVLLSLGFEARDFEE